MGWEAFDLYAQDYDAWFEAFPLVYQAELAAVRELLPQTLGRAVDIGVGTGRFAAPLGFPLGVEPSLAMAALARRRGVWVVGGTAEQLPLSCGSFDTVLMVTVLCFVSEPRLALQEATCLLKPGGRLVLGVLDPDSPAGRRLAQEKAQSRFFCAARFLHLPQLLGWLAELGYRDLGSRQTIFRDIAAITAPEPVQPGWGQGLFVVWAGEKTASAVARRKATRGGEVRG